MNFLTPFFVWWTLLLTPQLAINAKQSDLLFSTRYENYPKKPSILVTTQAMVDVPVVEQEANSYGDIIQHTSPRSQQQSQTGFRASLKFLSGLKLIESIMKQFFSIFLTDPDILRIVVSTSGFVVWSFMLLSALGSFGFDTKPLVSLLGISGLTVGFAAKDILKDAFAGLFIVFTKPFKRGWVISINGQRGKVISIDTRYVRLQNLKEKGEVLLPLSIVYEHTILIHDKNGDE